MNVCEVDGVDFSYDNMKSEMNNETIFLPTSSLLISSDFHANESDVSIRNERIDENSLAFVTIYSIVFVIAAVANLIILSTLLKSRHRKSRFKMIMTHLAVADLIIICIIIPSEISWRLIEEWRAGVFACQVFLFLQLFGLFLRSNVLISMLVDRYLAVLHPVKVAKARDTAKIMLGIAWGVSLLASLPKCVNFHASSHLTYPSFQQCVIFSFFPSRTKDVAYSIFCISTIYFVPLLAIIVAYTAIICKIIHKPRESNEERRRSSGDRMRIRRSNMTTVERTRIKTLKMTLIIVLMFLLCWTPYAVVTLWYVFDRESAEKVSSWMQNVLLVIAVSNSWINPVTYGCYIMKMSKEYCKCFCCRSINPLEGVQDVMVNDNIDDSISTRNTIMLSGVMKSPTIAAISPIRTTNNAKNRQFYTDSEQISTLTEPLNYTTRHRSTFHSDLTGKSPCYKPEIKPPPDLYVPSTSNCPSTSYVN